MDQSALFDFHMIVGLVVLIVAFGLLMVLSSSGVESYVLSGTSYARFWPQCMFAAIGLVMFVAVVRLRPKRCVEPHHGC